MQTLQAHRVQPVGNLLGTGGVRPLGEQGVELMTGNAVLGHDAERV
jgi:hypothetical protein